MHQIQDAFPLLHSPKKIFITCHHKPDGDAIGSVLGLTHYFEKKGHTVYPVIPSEVPDFLDWMPGAERLVNYEADADTAIQQLKGADLIFGLDFNEFSRTKHLTQLLTEATQPKILIDHHLLPAAVWDYGISIPEKSSTCEMVYDFIQMNDDGNMIDEDIAACLYTGLMTDTGSFRFPIATGKVHEMVADLKKRGLNHSRIHEEVYDNWSLKRLQFIGYVLLEKMEIFPEYNAGLIAISKKDLKLFEVSTGDLEGLVNYPLSIKGVKFATMITERTDEVKLSFRSKGNFDVSSFSREYFNGGGHFNASGGSSKASFIDTVTYFKKILSDIRPPITK
jgi:phosphoesterase RecJ-like protein